MIGIVTALSLFVFFPILKQISAAFVAPEGAVALILFLYRIIALACCRFRGQRVKLA